MSAENKKLVKAARVTSTIVRIVKVILVFAIFLNILQLIGVKNGINMYPGSNNPVLSIIQNIFFIIISLISLFIVSPLIKSIKDGHTPFTDSNVKRIKYISILIMVIEPVCMLINFIASVIRPVSENGIRTVQISFMGGTIIVMGAIVFCIALVFEHGVQLQKLSDETL